MRVHVFHAPRQQRLHAFTADETGANLPPPDVGDWKYLKAIDLKPSDARLGLGTAHDVLRSIEAEGYFLTTAALRLDHY